MTSHPIIQQLKMRLAQDKNVIAYGLFGAYANGHTDRWSEIALLIITNSPTAWRTFLDPSFLGRAGRVFHADIQHAEHFITLALTLEDFQQVRLVVVPQDRLRTVIQSGQATWSQLLMLQSRSETVTQLLQTPPTPPPTPTLDEEFARVQTLFHEVRDKAIRAIVAVVRDDRLSALNLVLDMLHDVMLMRQIWQRYHSQVAEDEGAQAYSGNDFADSMPPLDGSAHRLLQLIEWGLWEFSSSARNLFPQWDERNHTLMTAIAQARHALPPEETPDD